MNAHTYLACLVVPLVCACDSGRPPSPYAGRGSQNPSEVPLDGGEDTTTEGTPDAARPDDGVGEAPVAGLAVLFPAEEGSDAGAAKKIGPFAERGVTAKLGGHTVTYTNMTVVRPLSGDAAGMFKIEAGASVARYWSLVAPARVGTHPCGDVAQGSAIELRNDDAGGVATSRAGSRCSVHVTAASDGTYAGTFTGELSVTGYPEPLSLTEGSFYQAEFDPPNGGAGLEPGQQGASFVVDGGRYTYDTATAHRVGPYLAVSAVPRSPYSPGSSLGFQVVCLPMALGEYACGSGPADCLVGAHMQWKHGYFDAGESVTSAGLPVQVGSCTVKITDMGSRGEGPFEGTFSGTFVSAETSTSLIVSDGSFRSPAL
jgi:hypothetical protein